MRGDEEEGGGKEKQPISRAIGQPEDIALFGKGALRRETLRMMMRGKVGPRATWIQSWR